MPYRVFLLYEPARLVVDFREADWSGSASESLLAEPGRVAALRFGAFQQGWSRLEPDIYKTMVTVEIGMPIDPASGQAVLEIALEAADATRFAAAAGAPVAPAWPAALTAPPVPKAPARALLLMLDPGHGGIDPGAEREGVTEKDLMLSFARALAETLRRSGIEVRLTREEDIFGRDQRAL